MKKKSNRLAISLISLIFFFVASCNKVENQNDQNNEQRFSKIEAQLKRNNERLSNLDERFSKETNRLQFLNVVSENLNIRSRMSYNAEYIIAEAIKGAYLRKIKCIGKNCKWLLVDFLVDEYHYTGYISNSADLIKEECYSLTEFNKVYKKGLIKYYWEREAVRELKKKGYERIGVFLKCSEKYRPKFFFGHLVRILRPYSILLKPISQFNLSEIGEACINNRVEAILKIEIEKSSKLPDHAYLHIELLDNDSTYLYSGEFPFQSIRIPNN